MHPGKYPVLPYHAYSVLAHLYPRINTGEYIQVNIRFCRITHTLSWRICIRGSTRDNTSRYITGIRFFILIFQSAISGKEAVQCVFYPSIHKHISLYICPEFNLEHFIQIKPFRLLLPISGTYRGFSQGKEVRVYSYA